MIRISLLIGVVLALVISQRNFAAEPSASVNETVLPGHSHHGEAFNEGPRQAAYLMEGTGRVSFPATTANGEAQKFIDQGVGQLHGFWYFEAERSFRQAAMLDPDCAISYWGMAQANVENETRAKAFIAKAVERKKNITPREAMYIDALSAYLEADPKKDKERRQDYVKALENILHDHPDDVEAKAMLALQLWKNNGQIPISSHFAVSALLGEVFDANPMHPAHHYRIHLWDREKPERALDSAALCGPAAQGIAHMWHMPGHIYSRLKRYGDAVWQQEASARVDHAHMIRDRVLPDQIHNYAHNNEWLIRNLIHIGRAGDAVALAKNMLELPRHPKYNSLSKHGSSSAYGRQRLIDVLTTFELWEELLALSETMYLEPGENETDAINRLRYIGRAHFALGHAEKGQVILTGLEERMTRLREEETQAEAKGVVAARRAMRLKLIVDATPKESDPEVVAAPPASAVNGAFAKSDEEIDQQFPEEIKKGKSDAVKHYADRKKALERSIDEMKGHIAVAANDYAAGIDLMKKADLDPLLLSHIQAQAGQGDDAEKAVAKQVESGENEVLPLAHQVHLRWSLNRRDEAREAFDRLRALSSEIDLDAPPFAHLGAIAAELGYPSDWRLPREMPNDLGERPDLDSLGPLRWHPSPAPSWTLRDVAGREHSLADYRCKPVVVIFYLGFGCLHCAEQLQAFAPKTEEFAEAGLPLIAISTDEQEKLQKSIDNYGKEFPFPLVSDATLDVFRTYRAFDDFEQQPLHGTFLIDGDGLVRWHDIGYEPFMDPDFVLNEAKRLLVRTQPPATADAGQAVATENSTAVSAQISPNANPTDDGFVSMFDGESLEGWAVNSPEAAKAWYVEDGTIVGKGDQGTSYLIYDKYRNIANFEMKFSYRFPGKGNSGVNIRARKDETGRRDFQAYHADLGHVGIGDRVLGAWDFHTPGRREHGCPRGERLVIDENDEPKYSAIEGAIVVNDIRSDDWNDVHIIAQGNHFQFFINGKPASEFTEHLPQERRLESGMIQLQLHDPGMVVHFKDLRLKSLDDRTE